MDRPAEDPVEIVRRGYDDVSLLYRADDGYPARYARWIAELRDILEPGSRILDVGCGCGVPVARELAALGHEVTGVDLSECRSSALVAWCRAPPSSVPTSRGFDSRRARSTP